MGATTFIALRPALAYGAPSIPESERPRRRHYLGLAVASTGLVSCPLVPIRSGRASADGARRGPKAGAERDREPGARPAKRSAAGCLE